MIGTGEPKLLEWELKPPPFKGIGVLRFYGGAVPAKGGNEDTELVAVVDVDAGLVVAIEPHKQGEKVATWTWEQGKITVASVDGVTDEFAVRIGGNNIASPGWNANLFGGRTAGWLGALGCTLGGRRGPDGRAGQALGLEEEVEDHLRPSIQLKSCTLIHQHHESV